MSLVELGRFPARIDADLARLALLAAGIDSVLLDSEANSFFGGGGLIWVRLMVIDEDLDDARAVLAEP